MILSILPYRSRAALFGLVLGCSMHLSECLAQSDTWARKNDVAYNGLDGPSIGRQAATFSVGGKGYVISLSAILWEYDPVADSWTQRSAFPGGEAIGGIVCFGIGGKGYVCRTTAPVGTWAFDPADGSWTPKASFPGPARSQAVGFVVDGNGYLGTGIGTAAPYYKDLWAFDPDADSWTQRANLPGPRARAAAFSVGGKGYITGGTSSIGSGDLTYMNTTYEYDPAANTWTQRANYPAERMRMVSFSIGTKGYVGCGTYGFNPNRNLYAYDPVANTWTNQGTFGDPDGRDFGFGFALGGKGYIGGGGIYSDWTKSYNDFWCFDPATSTFTIRQYLGGMRMSDCSAFGIGATGHFIAGCVGLDRPVYEAWAYAPVVNTWSRRSYASPNYDASATFTIGTRGYKVGGCYRDINAYSRSGMRYDTGTDTWSNIAALGSVTGDARAWAIGFSANGKGYVGLGTNGTVKSDLWQYDPASNSWTRKADFPGAARQKAVAFRIGDKVYVGTGIGTARLRDMWAYDTATDTWTQKADFGGTARYGAVAFTIGSKGYVATGDDGTLLKDLWEYDPVTDIWTQKADFAGVPRRQAIAFVIGAKAYVGTGVTNFSGTTYACDMWEYTPVDDASAVRLRPKVLLDGPYDSASGLMSDALRTAGLVPLSEPYTALGYPHSTSGGESTMPSVLAAGGNDAIVDWVVVELRHPGRPEIIMASACALVQRDGDIVGTDGSSPVTLFASAGTYHVTVRHRNHLAAMTAAPVAAGTMPATIDLTLPSTAAYGTEARKMVGSRTLLWAGDVRNDGRIAYTGANNDRDPILVTIGGAVPTQVTTGIYSSSDVNMDGMVKYTGAGNDRDRIFQNIGGSLPTQVRVAQMP